MSELTGGIELSPLLVQIKVNFDEFQSQMKQVSKTAVNEAQKIEKQFQKISKAGDKIAGVGKTLTASLTLPIVGLGVAAVKSSLEFDDAMAKVSTIADETAVPISKLREEIIDLSDETGVAVGELAEAEYNAISAGVKTADSITFIEKAVKLAKGGFTSTTASVDILTTALNGYKLKAEETIRVSDVLITTQNLGKTTVDELSGVMGKVIPIASATNVEIEQLGAGFAQLTANGIQTAETGTYMKSMLSELSKTGSQSDKVLRQVAKKSFAEMMKEGKSLSEVLMILNDHAEDNGLTLKDMFSSVEAGSAALVLGRNEGKDFNDILSQMSNSSGATEKAFMKMQTPGEEFRKTLNRLKNSMIEFGNALTPVFNYLSTVLSEFAKKMSSLSEGQIKAIIGVLASIALLGPALIVIGKIVKAVGTIGASFAKLSLAITKAGGFIKWIKPLITAITGPIGIVIAVLAVLTTAFIKLYKENEVFRDIVNGIWNQIKDLAVRVFGYLREFWDKWGADIMNVFNGIATIIGGVVVGLVALFQIVWPAISNVVMVAVNLIGDIIGSLFKILSGIIDFIVGSFTGDWEKGWGGIVKVFGGIWDAIVGIVEGAVNMIGGIIEGLISGIKKVLGWLGIVKDESTETNTEIANPYSSYTRGDLPSYAVGTNYVPRDMIAKVHKGEMIVPKSENPYAGGRQSINHTGTIRVEGINGKGELTAVVDIIMNQMRKEARAW